ncbi:heterokaryon incompatibility protein-domain-containing protein [Xylariaceae sp. FL1019]|nr:heterokaryon incompatibility protein-domain-containing protein [Xylariaceae sp. FL1019]
MDHEKTGKITDVSDPVSQCPLNVCNNFFQSMHQRLYRQYGAECTRDAKQTETSMAARGSLDTRRAIGYEFLRHEDKVITLFEWQELSDASKAGCPTCGLFTKAIDNFYPGGADSLPNVPVEFRHYWENKSFAFSLQLYDLHLYGSAYYGAFSVKLYAPIGHIQCSWPLPPIPASLNDPSPTKKLALVKAWLSNCMSNHTACREIRSLNGTAWHLPKRVVDVRYSQDRVRLHESTDETAQYVCLSHVWGESQPLKATRASVESFKKGIGWQHIPRTFQDAICVVRSLGFRYLWIDSLCIIQDDPKDWAEQAALMCDIYSNATLTIFATRITGCTDTLFPSFQHTLQGRDEEGNPLKLAVRVQCSHLDEYWAEYPLLRRGWAFQERLLSRRIIHFGYDEVFWECREHSTCECSDQCQGPSAGECYDHRRRETINHKLIHRRYPKSVEPTYYRRLWHAMVVSYSRLQLTFQSDRPSAILGLAAEMASRRRGRYIVGLWEDSLVADLAWAPVHPKGPFIGAKLSGPSWSWVSYTYSCQFPANWSDGDVRIIGIEEKCPSAAGGKSQTCITLSGKAVSGIANLPDHMPSEGEHPALDYCGETWFMNTFGLKRYCAALFSVSTDRELSSFDGDTILYLSLGVQMFNRIGQERGLVLRCIDVHEQQYERIGTAQICELGSNWAEMFSEKHRVVTIGLV